MNIKLQTNEQLSAMVANGLGGVFINGVSLSASLSGKADLTALQNCYTKSETSSANEISTALENAGGKVYFDNRISGITGSNDLSVVRLSADEYAQMLDGGTCLSNAIYIVEAPNIDAFKQQIKNLAPGTDLSDAVNLEQLSNALSDVQIPTDLSAFTNSPGYLVSNDISDYYKKSETSSSSEIQSALDKKQPSGDYALTSQIPTNVSQLSNDAGYLTEHQSLSNYYQKSETSSATEISAGLASKLESTAAAPNFDSSKTYDVGEYVTYDGMLYECTSAVTTTGDWMLSNWISTDMTTPDATLDLMADRRLRLVSTDGDVLWMQGYELAQTSSTTLSCDSVNYFAYEPGLSSQTFVLPSVPIGKVGDFVLDVDNTANVSTDSIATLQDGGSSFDIYTASGNNIADILTFAGNEQCELYFTMTAFGTAAKPAWKVVKQVVEKQEFGS